MAVAKQKIKKIIKMGDLLCASYTLEEAYGVIGREMSTLFPAGAFYRYDAAKNLLDAAAIWGDTTGGVVLAPEDCFAVRRNRPHLVAGPAGNLPCPHATGERPTGPFFAYLSGSTVSLSASSTSAFPFIPPTSP